MKKLTILSLTWHTGSRRDIGEHCNKQNMYQSRGNDKYLEFENKRNFSISKGRKGERIVVTVTNRTFFLKYYGGQSPLLPCQNQAQGVELCSEETCILIFYFDSTLVVTKSVMSAFFMISKFYSYQFNYCIRCSLC